MDNDGAVVEEVALRTTVRTRLRLNATPPSVPCGSLRQQQREFYNTGVEIGLFARNNGESDTVQLHRSHIGSIFGSQGQDAPVGPPEPDSATKRTVRRS